MHFFHYEGMYIDRLGTGTIQTCLVLGFRAKKSLAYHPVWGQDSVGLGGAGLEREWGWGMFKAQRSHLEMGRSRVILLLTQPGMS